MTAISWEGPQLRARGTHHRRSRLGRLKQRLVDWNEREQRAQDEEDRRAAERLFKRIIRDADLKANAGKTARDAALWVPCAGLAVWLYAPALWIPDTLAAAYLWGVAAIVGAIW